MRPDLPHPARRAIIAAAATILALSAPGVAWAAEPPVKEILTSRLENGIENPRVAVNDDPASPEHGDLYITDNINHRVQVLTPAGAFVEMFGWEVNATKDDEAGATQAEKNACTAASKDACQAGVGGPAAGQVAPGSIAVDPSSDDVYVAEQTFANEEAGDRVQEFTAAGAFVLEIGHQVNHTTKANLCTAEEAAKGDECGAPVSGGGEQGAFDFEVSKSILAAGGKEDLLYVGDEERVQEFDSTGKWVKDIPLEQISNESGSRVQQLALDQETGDIYLICAGSTPSNVIRQFDAEGNETTSITVNPNVAGRQVFTGALAVDPAGRLAVGIVEEFDDDAGITREVVAGKLYAPSAGRAISDFTTPSDAGNLEALAFDGEGHLYLSASRFEAGEVLTYTPKPVAELSVGAAVCNPSVGVEASVVFECTLGGEVDPEGVSGTEALFEWGTSDALGRQTASQQVGVPGPVQDVVDVAPGSPLFFELVGYDQNVKPPEQLATEQATTSTPTVAPRILGAPSASFVSSSAAVLSGEVNPENTTSTYQFQYAKACAAGQPCPPIASSPDTLQTSAQSSAVYGGVGTSGEAAGLQPATTYRFQLVARNENGQSALSETGSASLPEATFTTAAAPSPSAETGGYGAVGSTSATITGSVDPDGAPTTYSFEVGVYEGPATQYGVIASGSAGAGSVPVQESTGLSGLQPGGTYAYRIAIDSGYIHNSAHALQGAPVLFTTPGLPALLSAPASPPLLATPSIALPTTATTGTSTPPGKRAKLTRAQLRARSLKACAKQPRRKRAACKRQAEKRYGSAHAQR